MIAGDDILLSTRDLGRLRTLEICVGLIHRRWRNAVFQSGMSSKIYVGHGAIPWGIEHEIFVYRDLSAFDHWEKFGADPSNTNTMIHLVAYEENAITVVFDDARASDMAMLLTEMRRSILSMSFRLRPLESAA